MRHAVLYVDCMLTPSGGQAYSYHVYCLNTTRRIWIPLCKDIAMAGAWAAHTASRHRVGGGGMLTEFGAVGEDPVSLVFIKVGLDSADARLQSWAYWTYKSFDDITTAGNPLGESLFRSDGSLQVAKLQTLTRAYAPVIAGRPERHEFDNSTGAEILHIQYIIDSNITGNTVIFAHAQYHYSSGVDITIAPSTAAQWQQVSDNYFEIMHSVDVKDGERVAVELRRAS